ncbi:ATP-dependent RNA helicase prh1 [Papiliotrema laurentii]|uniref:RNA helicase n=1 Tax=Papiliotrema laurentii TaxID=5418 RepID=A0AAD9FPM1_PAPLA|nr:ATP-dependent RNA helicase prh1 [Papiliotrema laurentii]
MARATSPVSEAGPSSVKVSPAAKRVAEFADSSDDELQQQTVPHANGVKASVKPGLKKRKLVNGVKSKEDKEKEREERKAEAERLFVNRQQLPFYQGRKMILEDIMSHDTTIIIGETGCGKSTQLPQLLRTHPISLDHFSPDDTTASRLARAPRVAVTQPRRLPAIALANRVAAEMGVALGQEVGYSVRFEDMCGWNTGIRYMTEGVLMRELANADTAKSGSLNLLLRYDVVVVDEAHERTLNTDFICGALKRVQRIRKKLVAEQNASLANGDKGKGKEKDAKDKVTELKIVIMSATLDPAKFSRFFETDRDALLVKGRMYEVATRHVKSPVDDFIEAAAKNVMQIHFNPKADGDVLVFMPGSEEIENCCELLRRAAKEFKEGDVNIEILPLYASLPPSAQVKIFAPKAPKTRRVIVATNIAETSITIPGVAYVVDTGFKKEKEYIFRTSGAIEHLAKKKISQAAAWQRTGRAGRERAGECYRLFTQDTFDKFEAFDAPEIQRTNLASAVLQLIAMGLDPFEFEYIDNPGRDPISAAFQTLAGLGAISSPTTITDLGRDMLKYPLDPAHARILIASFEYGCPKEIIDILSLLNSGPVWIDRSSDRESAAEARMKYINKDGDHLTALNVFNNFIELREQKASNRAIVAWAKENHVNTKSLVQALKIREQLRDLAGKHGKDWKVSAGMDTGVVVRALLQGLFMNTAVIQADGTYRQTAGSLQVKIHPSSVLMSKKVPAIVYDELAITSSIYARNVSSFDQAWLTDIPWFKQANVKPAQPTL